MAPVGLVLPGNLPAAPQTRSPPSADVLFNVASKCFQNTPEMVDDPDGQRRSAVQQSQSQRAASSRLTTPPDVFTR